MSSERQLLDTCNPWWGEHVHRYNEVLSFLGGSDKVLDLACGTGFGSDILAQHTKGLVVGGDIAEEAIAECKLQWNRSNLQFMVLDGTRLPFDEGYFDKIISFETIEHTTEYQAMLREFYRTLKKGGTAFISTPNFPVNSPGGKVLNPYHTQEFTYDELKEILAGIFDEVKIFGQRYSRFDNGKVPKAGKWVEMFYNIIGIRKLPYSIKNKTSMLVSNRPFYPDETDYTMTPDLTSILECKTFFCVCRKS